MGVLMYSYTNVHNALQGRIQVFFRRGCTRLLLYFNNNQPHSFFFGRIPVVLENPRSSQGGRGAHPLHPPPRSAPALWSKNVFLRALLIWRKLSRVERSPTYPSYPRRTNFSYILLQNVGSCLRVKKKVGSARKDDLSSRVIILWR